MSDPKYHLIQSLAGHESDVRGINSSDVGITTTSRDKTARIWTADEQQKYNSTLSLVGHTDYVGPVVRYPPGLSPSLPNGALVTGSRDTTVIVWDPVTGDKIHTLTGHQYQVTALAVTLDGHIVSASLDKTIRVWKDGQSVHVLEGHEGPVLALVTLPGGDVLSGSGDTTIKRWSAQTGQCIATYKGHTDTVRALCLLPNVGFVSASHDQTLKVWTESGDIISELVGHTAIIYSVDATASGLIASGSEDSTVRVWRADGSCVVTIDHPGCIWDVAFTATDDLVTGCSDALAYIWSADSSKPEDADAVQALQSALAARTTAADQPAQGGGAAAGLPPGLKVEEKYVLHERGSKDGETKVVKEPDGSIWAYTWSLGSMEWEKIGEVVAAPAGGAAKAGNWDYTFDVDVSDGAPTRPLVGNYSENPYDVADRFLEQEGMPTYFRDQVVSFILQNTGGRQSRPDLGNMPVTGGFCDPFTGGSGSHSEPAPTPTPPPSAMPTPMDVTGGGVDPFTGSSGLSSSATTTTQYLPYQGYMLFDAPPPLASVTKKLKEFNAVLQQTAHPSALSEDELAVCDSLLARLTPTTSSSTPSPAELALTTKLLSFPKDNIFLVLDITRMLLLDPAFATALSPTLGSLSSPSPGTLAGALTTALSDPPVAPCQQTAARLICNCFKHEVLRAWIGGNVSDLLNLIGAASSSTNKNVRQGVATALLNFAVLVAGSGSKTEEVELQLMGAASELLASDGVLQEGETAFRALAAAGTLASSDKSLVALARDLGLDGVATQLASQPGASGKLLGTAQALLNLLKA